MNPATPLLRSPRRGRSRPGFTMTEVLIVLGLIIILTSLLFVAVGAVVRTARAGAERTFLRSIGLAINQYERQFDKSLPPLVDDDAPGGPVASDNTVKIRGASLNSPGLKDGPTRFLRYEDLANEPRWSRFTLSYYLLGTLPKAVDGVEGPGFTSPDADGLFAHGGRTYQPMFDFGSGSDRLKRETTGPQPDYRTYIADRWGQPIRFYRWAPTYHEPGNGRPSAYPVPSGQTPIPPNTPSLKGEIRAFNVPRVVGSPNPRFPGDDNYQTSLRSARWALVSGGPDGRIDDNEDADGPENKDNIVIWEGGQ